MHGGAPRRRPAGVPVFPEPAVDVAFAPGRGRGLWVGAGLVARVVRLDGADAGKGGVAAPVVGVDELVELVLQPGEVAGAGPGVEPLLEGAVPAFDLALRGGVAGPAVLLAHAVLGQDAFERARPLGAHDEPAGVDAAVVGERRGGGAVLGAAFEERAGHELAGHRARGARQEHHARMVVEPGDDLRVRAVGQRPVREVRLPRLVGQLGLEPDVRAARPFPGLGLDQTHVLEDAVDRGDGRGAAHPLREHAVDAARPAVPAPGEQAFAHLRDQGAHLAAGAVVHAARPARTRQQSRLALLAMARAQPVDPLARHAVALRDARTP